MKLPGRLAGEYALLTVVSAVLYAVFYILNDLLFSRLEHVERVNWLYLPSGFRVLLVLALHWPGAVGIMLGGWCIDVFLREEAFGLDVLASGMVSGFAPLAVKAWMERRGQINAQLHDLNIFHLLNFVLLYAACNALGHQLLWWWLERPGAQFWLDVWPMFVGDALGALVVLYALRLLLPLMGRWLPGFRS